VTTAVRGNRWRIVAGTPHRTAARLAQIAGVRL
jgi:hypothetical protein